MGREGQGGAYFFFGRGSEGAISYVLYCMVCTVFTKFGKTWGLPVCLFPGLESLGKMPFLGKVLESIGI